MRRIIILFLCLTALSSAALAGPKVKEDEVRLLLGDALLASGDYKGSIVQYLELLKKDPNNTVVLNKLAAVYAWDKQFPESIKIYEQLLKGNPNGIELKKKLAEVYLWNKQFDNSKALLSEVLAASPNDPQAQLLQAKALQYSGDPQAAVKIYEDLLKNTEKK